MTMHTQICWSKWTQIPPHMISWEDKDEMQTTGAETMRMMPQLGFGSQSSSSSDSSFFFSIFLHFVINRI